MGNYGNSFRFMHNFGPKNLKKNYQILLFSVVSYTRSFTAQIFQSRAFIINEEMGIMNLGKNSFSPKAEKKIFSGSWRLKICILQRILMVSPKISQFLKLSSSKSLEWDSQDSRFLLSEYTSPVISFPRIHSVFLYSKNKLFK